LCVYVVIVAIINYHYSKNIDLLFSIYVRFFYLRGPFLLTHARHTLVILFSFTTAVILNPTMSRVLLCGIMFCTFIYRIFVCHYLRQGGYVFVRVCLSVCLFECQQDNSKSYEKIFLKFSGNV